MESRLSPHDLSVLEEPGIDVAFVCNEGHPEMTVRLYETNFTHEQQHDYYYQWYADYQELDALHRKHEFRNFYRVKAKHETMLTR